MTERELSVLSTIADLTRPRGPTAGQLGERLGVNRQWSFVLLRRLVEAGLVSRGPGRGGHVVYSLTKRGAAALGERAS